MRHLRNIFSTRSEPGANALLSSDLQKGAWVGPLPLLTQKLHRLINFDLTIFCQRNFNALKRTGCGTFVINAFSVETATVAGAFKFTFRTEPTRCASEMCTDGQKCVEFTILLSDDPNPVRLFFEFLANAAGVDIPLGTLP